MGATMVMFTGTGVSLPLVLVGVVSFGVVKSTAGCGHYGGVFAVMQMDVSGRPGELQRQCEQSPDEQPSLPAQQRHTHLPNRFCDIIRSGLYGNAIIGVRTFGWVARGAAKLASAGFRGLALVSLKRIAIRDVAHPQQHGGLEGVEGWR